MNAIYSLAKLAGSWQVLVEQLRHCNLEGQTMLLATATKGFDNAVKALNQAIQDEIDYCSYHRAKLILQGLGLWDESIAAEFKKG